MTDAQKRLRDLRARQSTERGRMATLGMAAELTEEMRAEFDTLETGVPDLERQIRGATVAVETEEAEQRTVAPEHRDADPEARERLELRKKVRMSNYIVAAIEQRGAVGPEHEYNASVGISGNRFPLELLAPAEARAATEERATTEHRRGHPAAHVAGQVVR